MYKNSKSKVTAAEFDRIMNTEILEAIAKAFVSLHADLMYDGVEVTKEILDLKVGECKKTINLYIDGQVDLLLTLKKR